MSSVAAVIPVFRPDEFALLALLDTMSTAGIPVLVTDDAIRAQIHSRASEADIRAAAQAAGMVLMREDGERLVRQGLTSREELLRVTRD